MKLAILVVSLTFAAIAHATPTQAQLRIDRSETAAKVYAASVAAMKSGKANLEVAYQWSVRWLDSDYERATVAKVKKQALVDHAARMAELELDATKQRDAGLVNTSDALAATFFRIEADLWVLAGKPH